jgi:hypothetical protein
VVLAAIASGLWGCGGTTCDTADAGGAPDAIIDGDPARDAGEVSPDATMRDAGDVLPDATMRDAGDVSPDATVRDAGDVSPDATMRDAGEASPDATMRDAGEASPDATMGVVDPALDAPRALAPLSTSTVTSQRPTLRWVNAASIDGAVVELSRTRDFATVEHRLEVTGESVRLSSVLSAGVWFWRLRGRDSRRGTEGTATSPVWWFRVGARSADGDRDGSWGTELDLNGDGYADLAVGSPGADGERGRVDVYYGGPMGIGAMPSVTLRGGAGGDGFGYSVASAGDVNGDGYADLVVGARWADPGGRDRAGTASVYLGSASGVGATPARVLEGAAAEDGFGESVASAGDVNGDGYADLVVGAPYAAPGGRFQAGTASVFLGSASGVSATPARVLEGAAERDEFGSSVASAGDVNGDGYADLVVGAPEADPGGRGNAGTASVFLGSASGVGATPARVLEGAAETDYFGSSVASAGDVNGDGYADLVVGAPGASPGGRMRAGTASVYLGSASGVVARPARVLEGADAEDLFGASVASAGDVNGDGFADLLVGATGADPGGRMWAGTASVFLGSASGVAAMPARVLEGAAAGDQFGRSVASAGDGNGDGYADLVVGAPLADPGGLWSAGTASVYLGSASGVGATPARVLEGADWADQFGSTVASVDTVNRASPTRAPRHHRAIASHARFVRARQREAGAG